MKNTILVLLFLSFGLICCTAKITPIIPQDLRNQAFNLATVEEQITQFIYPQDYSGPTEEVIKFTAPRDYYQEPQQGRDREYKSGKSGKSDIIVSPFQPQACKSNCAVSFFSFRNKLGDGNRYLTYNSDCTGQVFWAANDGPSDLQKFVGYQFQNDVWTFQPKNCPNVYLRQVLLFPLSFRKWGWSRVGLSKKCSRWQVINASGNGIVKLWSSSPSKYWVGSVSGLVWAGSAITPLVVEYWAN